jgi:electron transfer flavoprotein alpha subunit
VERHRGPLGGADDDLFHTAAQLTSLIGAGIASSRANAHSANWISTMGVVITADLQGKK